MQILKQSTAYTFRLGPFVDSTDGFTPETALTIASSACLISKAGGAFAAKNDATALTGTGTTEGYYTCVLNSTDTGTVGNFRVHVYVSGALPVWKDYTIVPANAYDSLVGGTDYMRTHPGPFSISGTTITFKKTDNSTTQFTGTLTADAAANPIVGMSG